MALCLSEILWCSEIEVYTLPANTLNEFWCYCSVDDTFVVKLADFGMSKDVYSENYYREGDLAKPKPVKWMALESLREGKYDSTTEVVSIAPV